ncbi:hypothetical protein [Gracilibacillus oryzae]|uniref:hypothetical protein n=1 Tax=Gracilibacillus oryzae TaxID=1672701 RepID=UPI001885E569|nr:hypothetical protein [Gracilibacillus oryzae]
MQYYYNPEIHYLLISEPIGKVKILYDDNKQPFYSPKIGLRPPYYCNPRYEPYYPKI